MAGDDGVSGEGAEKGLGEGGSALPELFERHEWPEWMREFVPKVDVMKGGGGVMPPPPAAEE